MHIDIRSARPDDAAFLSWVLLTAGRAHVERGIWEVVIGEPEAACLSFLERIAITGTPHLFHHSCYLIAEADGRPVAGLGGYDPQTLGYDALRQALPEVLKGMGNDALQEEAMERRAARVLCCIPDEVPGAWIIDSVATLPEFRRKGIVSRLLEEIMETGRRRGFPYAQINMYIGNTPARRAYEKYGFRILDEKRDPDFEAEIGSPGMIRMVRAL